MMLSPAFFHGLLEKENINFFTGVPDSLLKNFCAFISDKLPQEKHLIAANEGGAVGLAIGHHLATGETPCVYMQNSGLGNIINPLLSLADPEVCNVPMLLVIGWRGAPGVKDEPQHVKQGRVMLQMLESMEIPYLILNKDEEAAEKDVALAVAHCKAQKGPFALIVHKNTFDSYSFPQEIKDVPLKRENAIEAVSDYYGKKAAFISTTGMASRELFETREQHNQSHDQDFLVIGGMGHASQIALGTALSTPDKTIVCLDGDGALLMHMGALAMNGTYGPDNFIHIVINNAAHESVGGQPTIAQKLQLCDMATATGYRTSTQITDQSGLITALDQIDGKKGPHFIEIIAACGHRNDLGRPTITPEQNKNNVQAFLQEST